MILNEIEIIWHVKMNYKRKEEKLKCEIAKHIGQIEHWNQDNLKLLPHKRWLSKKKKKLKQRQNNKLLNELWLHN